MKFFDFQVDQEDAYEHIYKLYKEVENEPQVIAMDVKKYLHDSKKLRDDLNALAAESVHWKQEDYWKKRQEGDDLIQQLQATYKLVLDSNDGMRVIKSRVKAGETAESRKVLKTLNKLYELMIHNNVPGALAKSIKQYCDSAGDNRLKFFCWDGYTADLEFKGQQFNQLLLFTADASTSLFHKQLKTNHYGSKEAIDTSFTECCTNLKANEKNHAAVSIGQRANPALANVRLASSSTESKRFELATEVTTILYVLANWAFSMKPEASIAPGMAKFLTCEKGFLFCTLVKLDGVLARSLNIETIASYCEEVGSGSICKWPAFVLEPGMSAFVPMGWVALIVGLTNDDIEGDETGDGAEGLEADYSAYTVDYVLDVRSAAAIEEAVRVEMHSHITMVIKERPATMQVDGNHTKFQTFLDEHLKPRT